MLASLLLVAACGVIPTNSPAPTPADFPTLAGDMALQGVKIESVVSGDPGCTDPVLTPTAIALTAHGLDQASPVKMYLYVFRNRAAFERLRETVDTCAQAYVTDPQTFESLDQSPFVLAGQGPWAPEFKAVVRAALLKAAGNGGDPGGNSDGM